MKRTPLKHLRQKCHNGKAMVFGKVPLKYLTLVCDTEIHLNFVLLAMVI